MTWGPHASANWISMPLNPETWLKVTEHGLYCEPGRFHIDPYRPVEHAVITHGHADHARPNNTNVLATPDTIAIMQARYGAEAGKSLQALMFGRRLDINGVGVQFAPAGHVLGSAQVVLEWAGTRVVASGDYKRAADPTCAAFEAVPCDVFITEATFGLPVFRHEPAEREIDRLLASCRLFDQRPHLVGAYGLGKCQRLIALLRAAGYDQPIWIHGAMAKVCSVYENAGVSLGDLRAFADADQEGLKGAIIMAPPSALNDRWSRRLRDPVTVYASGWMRIRGRARQRGVELPLVVSDHADWDELLSTIAETGAEEVWVTHGREDALVHYLGSIGVRGRALALIGREEEDDA